MIKTIGEARVYVGDRLYWEDMGPKFSILRSGILVEIKGSEMLMADGDWVPFSKAINLTHEEHPEWGNGHEAI